MQPPLPVRVLLTPAAKRQIEAVCTDFGMTQVSLLSRLVERFAKMPRGVQAAMLGLLPQEFEPDVVQLVLRHLQNRKVE